VLWVHVVTTGVVEHDSGKGAAGGKDGVDDSVGMIGRLTVRTLGDSNISRSPEFAGFPTWQPALGASGIPVQ
jgi:hypothetical protein